MSLIDAAKTLTDISFKGVKRSYALDELKAGVNKPNLPALLPIIATGDSNRETLGLSSVSFEEIHTLVHRYLDRPVQTSHFGEAQYSVAAFIDTYLDTIQDLSTHSGAMDLNVTEYAAGVVEWFGVEYHGCDFTIQLLVSE